jgi:hypothetical protein
VNEPTTGDLWKDLTDYVSGWLEGNSDEPMPASHWAGMASGLVEAVRDDVLAPELERRDAERDALRAQLGEAREFVAWLAAMDDPKTREAAQARRQVTLSEITARAAALTNESSISPPAPVSESVPATPEPVESTGLWQLEAELADAIAAVDAAGGTYKDQAMAALRVARAGLLPALPSVPVPSSVDLPEAEVGPAGPHWVKVGLYLNGGNYVGMCTEPGCTDGTFGSREDVEAWAERHPAEAEAEAQARAEAFDDVPHGECTDPPGLCCSDAGCPEHGDGGYDEAEDDEEVDWPADVIVGVVAAPAAASADTTPRRPPFPYEARQWMEDGARVECFSGKNPDDVVHEGWIIGMTEAPTVRVQKDDGQIISWVLGITRRKIELR